MFPTSMEDIRCLGSLSKKRILSEPGYFFERRLFKSLYPIEKKAISAPEFIKSIIREVANKITSTMAVDWGSNTVK